jgi:class 3 adenylate cyclase/tetratricopeptide (TPR) repeat protein
MVCTSCSSLIPEGARFCPSCGHAVGADKAEERRIVTVLFADLVGFTALAEYLDPEQAKRLVDTCFEQLVGDITAFGGRVDKILGDGILALFGAPIAHEDDPERAVRAALRMQHTLTRHVANSPVARDADIRMRVGVNTGEVLVGTLAGSDYTAMGDVVNTAARLQQSAPPGRVLVGETTYALTSHTFSYEPLGELVAKGREQSVRAWLAGEAIALPGTRRRLADVRLVGRDDELTLGRAALHLMSGQRSTVLLALSGESGVGKSRVIDELVDHVRTAHDAVVLEGTCVPYGEANVWSPVANALSASLDIDVAQDAEQVRATVRARIDAEAGQHDPAEVERLVEVFMHLFGFASALDRLDASAARSLVHRTVTKVLEMKSDERPIVLSIDDLHWADPLLVDLLEHLVRSLGRRAFALITAMRPGSDVSWPPAPEHATVVALQLEPLGRAETEELAAELLGSTELDPRLLTTLYERSGGNPLFLQELAALTRMGGGGRELPDSLRTLIAARLDQLTTEQRQVVDNAATLGTSGTVFGLERFAQALGQVFDPTTLRELDQLGLLEVRGTRWRFRSDSVREAAYQTITKAARAVRHAGVARSMRNVSLAGLDDVAHHAATAAELVQELGHVTGVPANITDEAISLLTTAADRALASGSLRHAVRHATRALDLTRPGVDPRTITSHLLLLRAEALVEQRALVAARTDIDAVLADAVTAGDVPTEAEARRLLGSLHHVDGHLDLARLELGRSVELLRDLATPERLARALRARGFIELFGGSLVDAEWFFGEADAIYTSLDDERGLAWIEQHRAWIAFLSGDMQAAHDRLHHAADALERLGDRNGVGWAFGLLAFVEFFNRNFTQAEALARSVAGEAIERGDDWAAGMMQTLLADLRLWSGDLEEALGYAERARSTFRKLNDKFGLVQSLAALIRLQTALGRTTTAQRSAEELLSLAETANQGAVPLLAIAGAAMHRGDAAVAVDMAERTIVRMEEAGGASYEPRVMLALGLAQSGRLDEALTMLDTAAELGDQHPFHLAVASLLHALSRDADTALREAEQVTTVPGSTYLDQVFAFVAAASAHSILGRHQQAVLAAEAAVAKSIAVGDVVAIALATRCYQRLTGEPHRAADQTALGEGWVRLLDDLFATAAA